MNKNLCKKYLLGLTAALTACSGVSAQNATAEGSELVTFERRELSGIGAEHKVMRRDPSDVIKVGDLYYVWYSKGPISPGYDATVWYATSKDGVEWVEKGEAVAKGEAGSWEGASVFTPNILAADGKYYLFYTGTSREYYKKPFNPDSKIGHQARLRWEWLLLTSLKGHTRSMRLTQ